MRIRWLGRVAYADAWALQKALFAHSPDNHLLLLEHPPVFTLGANAAQTHLLVEPEAVGAELHRVERGGDITYHGPGQLVGYPILSLISKSESELASSSESVPEPPSESVADLSFGRQPQASKCDDTSVRKAGGMIHTVAYVRMLEQLLIDALDDLGLSDVGRLGRYPGVWLRPNSSSPAKLAAVGVRLKRGRTMHGFALNVNCDLSWFDKIVPCGISGMSVTSLAEAGLDVSLEQVVQTVTEKAALLWGASGWERQDLPFAQDSQQHASNHATSTRHQRKLAEAGVSVSLPYRERKPAWMRSKFDAGPNYWRLKQTLSDLQLVTVCEEAGCPNISECWNSGTATFMINGDRCTRSCGFCLVDTRRPGPPDPQEPQHLAEAIAELQLDYAVLTAVARDDLPDGGAWQFAQCLKAIRRRSPDTAVEVLIPDFKGSQSALETVFAERPVVLNHNLETVLRLQRVVRPQASYARSLAVLAQAKAAGLTTKTSVMVGLGETPAEMTAAMADLAAIQTDILTIGQYLRPTASHLPVVKWWHPNEFSELAEIGEELGIGHVEAGPLVRSSYKAVHAANHVLADSRLAPIGADPC